MDTPSFRAGARSENIHRYASENRGKLSYAHAGEAVHAGCECACNDTISRPSGSPRYSVSAGRRMRLRRRPLGRADEADSRHDFGREYRRKKKRRHVLALGLAEAVRYTTILCSCVIAGRDRRLPTPSADSHDGHAGSDRPAPWIPSHRAAACPLPHMTKGQGAP
jgi:hypothetical protein